MLGPKSTPFASTGHRVLADQARALLQGGAIEMQDMQEVQRGCQSAPAGAAAWRVDKGTQQALKLLTSSSTVATTTQAVVMLPVGAK